VLGNLPSRVGRGPSGRKIANRAGGSPLAPRPRHPCICKSPVERSGRSRRWERERRCRDRDVEVRCMSAAGCRRTSLRAHDRHGGDDVHASGSPQPGPDGRVRPQNPLRL